MSHGSEQNTRPGIANKLGARWAKGVALTFEQTPLKAKNGMTRVTGLPLRAEISKLADDLRDREAGALPQGKSRRPASALTPMSRLSSSRVGLPVHSASIPSSPRPVTSSTPTPRSCTSQARASSPISPMAQKVSATDSSSHVSDMEEAYAIADLVVTRAGAGMVAELAALGIPAVVVCPCRSATGSSTSTPSPRSTLALSLIFPMTSSVPRRYVPQSFPCSSTPPNFVGAGRSSWRPGWATGRCHRRSC